MTSLYFILFYFSYQSLNATVLEDDLEKYEELKKRYDVTATFCSCYNAMECNTIQYNTIQYNTIQYNTIQYNTIQFNTIQYNTIQFNSIQYNTGQHASNKMHALNYHFPQDCTSLNLTWSPNLSALLSFQDRIVNYTVWSCWHGRKYGSIWS